MDGAGVGGIQTSGGNVAAVLFVVSHFDQGGNVGVGGHRIGCGVLWYCSRSEADCPVRIGQAVDPGAPVAVAGNAEQVVAVALLNHNHGVACHLVCQAVLRLAGDGGQGHGHRSVAVERIVVDEGGTRQGAPVGSIGHHFQQSLGCRFAQSDLTPNGGEDAGAIAVDPLLSRSLGSEGLGAPVAVSSLDPITVAPSLAGADVLGTTSDANGGAGHRVRCGCLWYCSR